MRGKGFPAQIQQIQPKGLRPDPKYTIHVAYLDFSFEQRLDYNRGVGGMVTYNQSHFPWYLAIWYGPVVLILWFLFAFQLQPIYP